MTSRIIPERHVDPWKCDRKDVQFGQELWPYGLMSAAAQSGRFVQDNHIGIISEHHPQIFDVCKLFHPQDDYGRGTSSGLIGREIPEQQGRALRSNRNRRSNRQSSWPHRWESPCVVF